MKKILIALVPLFFIFNNGCKDNATGSGDPFGGGGGGGTGGVTFTMSTEQGQQGVNFRFKPSTSVTVTQVTVSLPAQQFQDVVTNPNPNEVFGTANGFVVGEYTGVQTGQQWTFNVQGKIGSATGTAYNVNTNFTIP